MTTPTAGEPSSGAAFISTTRVSALCFARNGLTRGRIPQGTFLVVTVWVRIKFQRARHRPFGSVGSPTETIPCLVHYTSPARFRRLRDRAPRSKRACVLSLPSGRGDERVCAAAMLSMQECLLRAERCERWATECDDWPSERALRSAAQHRRTLAHSAQLVERALQEQQPEP